MDKFGTVAALSSSAAPPSKVSFSQNDVIVFDTMLASHVCFRKCSKKSPGGCADLRAASLSMIFPLTFFLRYGRAA